MADIKLDPGRRDKLPTIVRPDADRLIEMVEQDEQAGFCLACGDEAFGIEPDARKYACESCGEHRVYGAQELLLRGFGGAQ